MMNTNEMNLSIAQLDPFQGKRYFPRLSKVGELLSTKERLDINAGLSRMGR